MATNPLSKLVTAIVDIFTGGSDKTYDILNSQMWQKPSKYTHASVLLVGGGGGGGGAPITSLYGGRGGFAGEIQTIHMSLADVPLAVQIDVGAGGTGGVDNTYGADGGATHFGYILRADGGKGGAPGIDVPYSGNLSLHQGSPGENSYMSGGIGGMNNQDGKDASSGGGGGGAGGGKNGGKGGPGYCRITCWR